MNASIEGKDLVIRLPLLSSPRPSASGKTLVVATSSGNQTSTVQVAGKNVVIGANAYIAR